MIVTKRRIGTFLWILSPVALLLGSAQYMNYALAASLGPMEVQLLFLPLGLFLVAGLCSIGGYLFNPPNRRIVRVVILWIYTVPAAVLACFSAYASMYMVFLSATDDHRFEHAVLHRSKVDYIAEDRAIFTAMNVCLANWRGLQQDCDNIHYVIIVPEAGDEWAYTGGGTLNYVWKKKDANGNFTEASGARTLEMKFSRGPVIAVSSREVPLNNGELIVVKLDSNWEPHVARGAAALDELALSESTRAFVDSCVSGRKCTAK